MFVTQPEPEDASRYTDALDGAARALVQADVDLARERLVSVAGDLERRFLDQLDRVMDRLIMFPNGAPPVDGFPGVRRARIRQFPYGNFYCLDEDDVLLLRVVHTRHAALDFD